MRRRMLTGLLALAATLSLTAVRADVPSVPTVPLNRSTEPVVLTGAQFPTWSAGPDPTFHEPQPPVNYETADIQPMLGPLASECYVKPSDTASDPHANPYDYSDNGDHSCSRPSRLPRSPLEGADVSRLLAYKWDEGAFVQIPFQVDEKFTRFITNNVSGFAFYSGVDKETSYAFDREAFRYTSDAWLPAKTTGDPCLSRPKDGVVTTLDPVKGLDDDDELAFMYRDTGDAAPADATKPSGIASMFTVTVADPTNPTQLGTVYVALSDVGGPAPLYNASNGYVSYQRDANADRFAYSQSSYDGYGAAPKGPYCDADGNISTTYHNFHGDPPQPDVPAHGITVDGPNPKPWAIEQRRPLDGAWVKTPRYWFRYDGRWLMTGLRISPDDSGLNAQPNLGPDIIDQWKARAFQQRPGGETPCCGYEEEVNNWGGSSILFGERAGPVRVIRAAWGADSSTNNIKTEVFYRDEIRFQDNLRVHVIPPLDGIYVQWDYNASAMLGPDGPAGKYFNPWKPEGVAIDGANDEVFGNTVWHVASDRAEIRDDDEIPVVGPQAVTVPLQGGDPNSCESINGDARVCNDIDLADPFFSGPAGNLNWEQVSSPHGSVVTRWTVRQHTGGDAYSVIAQPYYRDDSCFDDGTGTDPGPHLRSRHIDDGSSATYLDPISGQTKPRVCWTPDDGDPYDLSKGDGRPQKFWQGDIATHGLHIQLIADSDNAQLAEQLTEIDSEQRMVVLQPSIIGNHGDEYGRAADFPLVAVVTPFLL
jgi:hypothetical protein